MRSDENRSSLVGHQRSPSLVNPRTRLHDFRNRIATLLLAVAAFLVLEGAIPPTKGDNAAPSTRETKSISKINLAPVTVHAEGYGAPFYKLQDGRQMAVTYRGSGAAALQSGNAEPRVLTSADVDGNATPDVVAGYAYQGKGIVTIQHGNPEAFAPTDKTVYAEMAQGYNPDALLPEVETIEVPESADFIEVGDFNGDMRKDILVGTLHGGLWLLAGNENGLSPAQQITLPGSVTALAAGEFRAADGRLDVVVGVSGAGGAQLLIYDGATGGLTGEPMQLPLPAEASVIRFGGMDDDPFQDLVVAAGSEIQIIYGWGRKESPNLESRVEHIAAGADVRGLSLGHYIWDRAARLEIAALAGDGTLQIIASDELNTQRFSEAEMATRTRGNLLAQAVQDGKRIDDVELAPGWAQASGTGWSTARTMQVDAVVPTANPRALLTTTNLYLRETEEVAVATNQGALTLIRQLDPSRDNPTNASSSPGLILSGDLTQLSLDSTAAPVATLQLRPKLNGERDLVVMEAGTAAISIVPLAATTITVDRLDDPVVTTAGSGAAACTGAANDCSLRGAVLFSNVAANSPTTINLPAGIYSLTINGTTDVGCGNPENGDLGVNMSTNIVGLTTGAIIIQKGTGPGNDGDRVMCMDETFLTNLTNNFSNITIVGGREGIEGMPNVGSAIGGAGIIGGELSNSFTLTDVTFVNNQSVRVGSGNSVAAAFRLQAATLPSQTVHSVPPTPLAHTPTGPTRLPQTRR